MADGARAAHGEGEEHPPSHPLESAGRRWYGLAVEMRREAVAWEWLADRDFEVLLPTLVEREACAKGGGRGRLRGNRSRVVTRPLFPGYLFLCGGDRIDWETALAQPGVIDVIREGTTPLPARPGAVEHIAKLMAEGDGTLWWDRKPGETPALKAGPLPPLGRRRRHSVLSPFEKHERLRVTGGPFASFYAQYLEPTAYDEHKILVDIFGRSTVVEVSSALVERA